MSGKKSTNHTAITRLEIASPLHAIRLRDARDSRQYRVAHSNPARPRGRHGHQQEQKRAGLAEASYQRGEELDQPDHCQKRSSSG